ncbi:MAG TPA: LysR family transcriptional regulator [Caulobacteraceae bacterium]|jgi:DNA-binding transcriptional LysR family regulator
MEFRTLRAFVEVVRQGGFTQAAKTIFATQSTVSKAVKQLEDEIGAPLLDRAGHGATLTAAGEIVFSRAVRLLNEREDLMAELDELGELKRGTLRLGLPPVCSGKIFAPYFAVYRRRYPQIDVRLTEFGAERLEDLLLAGKIELAASLVPVDERFQSQDVKRDQLVAAIGLCNPLSQRSSVSLADLQNQPLILFDETFALTRIVLESCRSLGIAPEIVARSTQVDFIVELVAAGLGVAFLPSIAVDEWPHPAVAYVPITSPAIVYHTTMVWRAGGFLSHAAQAWLGLMREAADHGPSNPQAPHSVLD